MYRSASKLGLFLALSLTLSFSPSFALDSKSEGAADKPKGKQVPVVQTMHGYISSTAPQDEIAGCIDEALSKAIEISTEAQKASKAVSKHNKASRKVLKATKDAINYMVCDRGFLPSIEGGELMLDEKAKVNSKASAEYAKQSWLDRTHDHVVEDVVEMITGFGTSDPDRRKEILDGALSSMKTYTDETTAQHVYDRLNQWSQQQAELQQPDIFKKQPVWSTKERQSRMAIIASKVAKDDPVVGEVTQRVHRYSKHRKITVIGSQVVETALNTVSLSPTFVGPAAQAALLGFFMVTGGTEEDKLLSEMYMGKRLQSRKSSLQNQASMALNAHQMAVQTHNLPLLSCSELLVRRLGGADLWQQVLNPTATTALATSTPAPVTATPATAADSAAESTGKGIAESTNLLSH